MEQFGEISVEVRASLDKLLTDFQRGERAGRAFDRAISGGMSATNRAVETTREGLAGLTAQVTKTQATWQGFLKQNLAGYTQLEGSHSAAMKRMSAEWGVYKAAVAGGAEEVARLRQLVSNAGPSPQQLLGIVPSAQGKRDVAAFGADLDALREKYSPLYAAQVKYRQSLTEMKTALASGVLTQAEYARALMETKVAFVEQVNAINGLDHPLTQAGAAMRAFGNNTFMARNLMFQMVDIMTVAPMAIASPQFGLMQLGFQFAQIGQMYYGQGGLRAALKDMQGMLLGAGRYLLSFITPLRVLGVVGAAVAGTMLLLRNSLQSVLSQFKDLEDRAGGTVNQLRNLQKSAETISGISRDDFMQGMVGFGQAVQQAEHNAGSLADLLHVNGIRAHGLSESLAGVADLIGRARNEQDKYRVLQEAGLPATRQWVQFLSQGSETVRYLVDSASSLTTEEQRMIDKAREFENRWGQAWDWFATKAKSAAASAISWIDSLITKADDAIKARNQQALADYAAKYGKQAAIQRALDLAGRNDIKVEQMTPADAAKWYDAFKKIMEGPKTNFKADLERQLQLENQRIQALGQLATVEQQVRAVENQLRLERLQPGSQITQSDVDRILAYTRMQAENAQMQERATYGVTTAQEIAKNKTAEFDFITQKYNLTAAQQVGAMNALERKYRDIAEASVVAASKFPELTRAALDAMNAKKQMDGLATRGIDSVSAAFADAVTGAKSLKDATRDMAISIIRDLTQMIIKAQLYRMLTSAFPGAFGGAGALGGGFNGLLGGMIIPGILHGGGGVSDAPRGPAVPAAYFASAPRFAAGLNARAPGINEVPIMAHKGELVGWPEQFAAAFGSNSAKVIQINMTMDLTGANGDETIKEISAQAATLALQQGAQQLSEYDHRLPARINEINVRGG